MKRNLIIIFLISVLNFWFWRLLKLDLFMAVLVLSLSILLSFSTVQNLSGKNIIVLFFLVFLIAAISTVKGGDRGLFKITQLEISTLEIRHEYYAKELGRFYKNRAGIFFLKKYKPFIAKIEKNLYSPLDINLYFFASHPRERGGVAEFEKYPFILLPVFILGLIAYFKKPKRLIFIYFFIAMVVNIFLHPAYNLGPILFYPLINTILFLGVLSIDKFVKKT